MKNKFLVIAAASTAALGTALLSAPAHAQITGSNVPVNLNVTVPEVLFLKTVKDINVNLSAADLASQFAGSSTGGFAFDNNSGTAGAAQTGVNVQTPFAGTATSQFNQSIPSVYVVWSNSPRAGGVNITFNKGGSLTGSLNAVSPATGSVDYTIASTSNLTQLTPKGLVTPTVVGGVDLALDLTKAANAGQYTGVITVTADAP
jgi:hypothetical protein